MDGFHAMEGWHRRQKRQVVTRVVQTTTVTGARTTQVVTRTVLTTVPRATTTPVPPAKPPVSTVTPVPPVRPGVTTSGSVATSASSTVSSVLPTTSSTLSSAPPTTTPLVNTSVLPKGPVTVTKTESAPAATSSTETNAQTGATSVGTTIGIVFGVIAGLMALGAVVAFIVRHMRVRKRKQDEFNASQFRKSALVLEDKDAKPRPPSMIEKHVANKAALPPPPPSSAYGAPPPSPYARPQFGRQFDQREGSIYGAPSMHSVSTQGPPSLYGGGPTSPGGPAPYGAPHPHGAPPLPYGGQNMYNQYSDMNNLAGMGGGYGAGAGAGGAFGVGPAPYAPYQQLPQQHPQGRSPHQQFRNPGYPQQQQQQYGGAPPSPQQGYQAATSQPIINRSNTTVGQLPNPFTETAPPLPAGATTNSQRSSGSDSDHGAPPPAYSDDGTYANLKRDEKTPVVMSSEKTATPGASSSNHGHTSPPPAPAQTANANADANSTPAATRRPISSHSTMYDPADAYGGM